MYKKNIIFTLIFKIMANEKFKLNFCSDGIGLVDISEPIGFNALSFDFMQKANGMGRDISFNSGEMQLEFTHTRNHYLPELLYYFEYYGFEAKVELVIEINGIDNIIGELDFAKAETDGLEYFRCKVIQKSELQIIKRRSKVKVDMFSDKDLDGNFIDKAPTTNVLVKAKAVYQESKWEQTTDFNVKMFSLGSSSTAWYQLNPALNIIKSDINDTLTSFNSLEAGNNDFIDGSFTDSSFKLISAKENLTNIKVSLENLKIKFNTDVDNGGNGYVEYRLVLVKGLEYINGTRRVINSVVKQEYENYSFEGFYNNISVEPMKRGESLWLFFEFKIRQSAIGIVPEFEVFLTIDSGLKVKVTAESTAYNSITKAIRLNDIQKQIIKSYAGIDVLAPRYQQNGQFYDTFLINGNLLRSITDKPFTISLDELSESLKEHNGDYEVNEKVFFGIYEDYYTNIECGFFDNTQFSSFQKKFNEKYAINTFNFKYKNYQALKENEQPNSSDTIHGEVQMLLANKMVENTKTVNVEWTRDSFLIDEARKKTTEITTDTAYQNDSDVFALDCVKNEGNISYTESSELNHEWSGDNLILRSNETLNFNVIGVFPNTPFEIKSPDKNTGFYIVYKVSSQELQLTWVSGGAMTTNNNGIRYTQYTYTIPKEEIPYVSRTTEGITTTSNLKSPETFGNILYSIKRNVMNYYNSYLATCNMYHKEKAITNAFYKNNGEAIIVANGVTTTEKQDFVPSNPILSPYMYEAMVFANVEFIDSIELEKSLRSKRGYIRGIDKNGNPIKVYPTKMTYKNLEKELTIIAEEKYEPTLMTIETSSTFTTINKETKVYHLEWKITNNQLNVFDSGMFRLYQPVDWFKVSVNGAIPSTIKILEDGLRLIK
jgi:hypothetical protein